MIMYKCTKCNEETSSIFKRCPNCGVEGSPEPITPEEQTYTVENSILEIIEESKRANKLADEFFNLFLELQHFKDKMKKESTLPETIGEIEKFRTSIKEQGNKFRKISEELLKLKIKRDIPASEVVGRNQIDNIVEEVK